MTNFVAWLQQRIAHIAIYKMLSNQHRVPAAAYQLCDVSGRVSALTFPGRAGQADSPPQEDSCFFPQTDEYVETCANICKG